MIKLCTPKENKEYIDNKKNNIKYKSTKPTKELISLYESNPIIYNENDNIIVEFSYDDFFNDIYVVTFHRMLGCKMMENKDRGNCKNNTYSYKLKIGMMGVGGEQAVKYYLRSKGIPKELTELTIFNIYKNKYHNADIWHAHVRTSNMKSEIHKNGPVSKIKINEIYNTEPFIFVGIDNIPIDIDKKMEEYSNNPKKLFEYFYKFRIRTIGIPKNIIRNINENNYIKDFNNKNDFAYFILDKYIKNNIDEFVNKLKKQYNII